MPLKPQPKRTSEMRLAPHGGFRYADFFLLATSVPAKKSSTIATPSFT